MRLKNASVLTKYTISYLGIALLSCMVVSLIFLYTYLSDLAERQEMAYIEKAQLVVADMALQAEILQNVAHKISINTFYRPNFLNSGKYNEIRMLEDFKRFDGYSSISKGGFLLYRSEPSLFLTSGQKADAALYFAAMGMIEAQALVDRLHSVEGMMFIAQDGMDSVLAVFPVGSPKNREATLGFLIDKTMLAERIETVSGYFDGGYRLAYRGEDLLTLSWSAPDDPMQEANAASGDGVWTFAIAYDGRYRLPERLRTFTLSSVIIAIMAVTVLAILTAYNNYKPIKRLSTRHAGFSGKLPDTDNNNEFRWIEAYMEHLADASLQAKERLQSSNYLMRQQLLQLLINGIYTAKMDEHMADLGIQLHGPWFFIMVIRHDVGAKPAASQRMDEIIRLIDDLSDDDSRLYAANDDATGHIIILASISDRALWEDLDKMVEEVLVAKEYPGHLGKGKPYESLSRISSSYLEAVFASNTAPSALTIASSASTLENFATVPPSDPRLDRKKLADVVLSVKAGNLAQANREFINLMRAPEGAQTSILMQRYVFAEIMVALIAAARTVNATVPEHVIYSLVMASTQRDFEEAVCILLREICEERDVMDNIDARIAERVIGYIRENIELYNLSLESISDNLDLSVTRVSNIVRTQTGMYYKDYVISLRIERAKEYLVADKLSVAETCARVGYRNISHFIKTFKAIVGITPGSYQRQR